MRSQARDVFDAQFEAVLCKVCTYIHTYIIIHILMELRVQWLYSMICVHLYLILVPTNGKWSLALKEDNNYLMIVCALCPIIFYSAVFKVS